MIIILDTHIILWAIYEDSNLSNKAKNIISCTDNAIFYSVVSTWEVLLKHIRHPKDPHYDLHRFLSGCSQSGFLPLNLCDEHVAMVETLSLTEDAPEHKDPFDKLLLAQAKRGNFLFLTHDGKLSGCDEPCVIMV